MASYYSNSQFFTIQNSMKGRIDFTYNSKTCSIAFTPVFNAVKPNEIQQGMKVYNYQEQKYFGLDISEVTVLRTLLDYYKDNGEFPDDGGQKIYGTVSSKPDSVSIAHYPKIGGISILNILVNKDSGLLTIGYKLLDSNKQEVFKLYLSMNKVDQSIFRQYLENYPNFITSYIATQKALTDYDKIKNPQDYQQTNNQNKNNQPYQSSQSKQSPNQSSQQQTSAKTSIKSLLG